MEKRARGELYNAKTTRGRKESERQQVDGDLQKAYNQSKNRRKRELEKSSYLVCKLKDSKFVATRDKNPENGGHIPSPRLSYLNGDYTRSSHLREEPHAKGYVTRFQIPGR